MNTNCIAFSRICLSTDNWETDARKRGGCSIKLLNNGQSTADDDTMSFDPRSIATTICRYCQFASVQFDSVGDHNAKMTTCISYLATFLPSLSLSPPQRSRPSTWTCNCGSKRAQFIPYICFRPATPIPYVCIRIVVGPHVHAIENKQVQLLHELLQRHLSLHSPTPPTPLTFHL